MHPGWSAERSAVRQMLLRRAQLRVPAARSVARTYVLSLSRAVAPQGVAHELQAFLIVASVGGASPSRSLVAVDVTSDSTSGSSSDGAYSFTFASAWPSRSTVRVRQRCEVVRPWQFANGYQRSNELGLHAILGHPMGPPPLTARAESPAATTTALHCTAYRHPVLCTCVVRPKAR